MPSKPTAAQCRLLNDPPAAGTWNMAVDEALLESSARQDCCCWRFYRWEEATLSLGYFQPYDDRQRHDASRDCPVVRRPSGGGAIVHDAELTYSVVVPAGHALARQRNLLYEMVHQGLISALADWEITARLCEDPPPLGPEQQPFLCFRRRAPGDVLVGAVKIAGSAQRRRRGAVLQHGSVLLARSPAAPECDGLAEIAGKAISADALANAWLEEICGKLGVVRRDWPLSRQELRRAEALARSQYGCQQWTENRRKPAGIGGNRQSRTF